MSVEVVMPQMGESITEGTISKWLKKIGETVEKDEAILEISTDKVDAEVPSSGAGVLLEIRHQEGETVEVGTVLAVVGSASEVGSSSSQSAVAEVPKVVETPEIKEVKPAIVEIPQAVETPQPVTATAFTTAATAFTTTAAEIVMPQMGESITEGTVSKWLKKVGDAVEKDEAILEISTDKVDAEVPSSTAGTLLEIKYQEGETVEVGTVLALVGSGVPSPRSQVQSQVESPKAEVVTEDVKAIAATAVHSNPQSAIRNPQSIESLRQTKSSPLVRNIAKEHGVDLSRIPGSGISGRVTKSDILSYLDTGAALRPQDLLVKPLPSPSSLSSSPSLSSPQVLANAGDKVEPMSNMRKRIAENMVISRKTSAHVTSVYEIDMTNVVKFRDKNKAAFAERFGTKLTFMPFIFQAVTQALRKYPVINAQVDGDKIIYKNDVNLGMAVALDWGLIVPVIKHADTLSLSGLTLTANDLAERARTKKLNPDEVTGGTFTITNTGTFGGLFGTPIINQPQVAILCFGTIEKRPKVLTTPDGDDYIAIRSMAYFALTYDHRIVDGSDGEKFLSFVKNYLETTQFSL
jgi:pyruvate dehydrogenase E2 component (dihydrolipoamide acetyltransferase)